MRISEGKPWKETLLEVLPQRKFTPKGKRKHENSSSSSQVDKDEEMTSKIEDMSSKNEIPNENESSPEGKADDNPVATT